MSKRKSSNTFNTLFNYFSSPPPKKIKVDKNETDETINGENESNKLLSVNQTVEDVNILMSPKPQKSKRFCNEDSDDEPIGAAKKTIRMRVIPTDSDDSDAENKGTNTFKNLNETSTLKLHDSFKYEANQSKSAKPTQNVPKKESPDKAEKQDTPVVSDEGNWIHCKLNWLKPGNIRDAEKRHTDHPEYDPTTLFVPSEFLQSQTPAHRQWWEMKATNFDCVLFFKVGKFYELYHMDAAVGVNELGFTFMKGEFAHSGFPESAYGRMASTLVAKGFKVARVEQTETPQMMQERCKQMRHPTKYDKVVRREICQVTVKGTQVCGLQDPGPCEDGANYMMAIAEEENQGCSTYGVCFVDTSIGQFHIGQFKDDKHSSRLLTTLAHFPPVLVVYDRRATSRTARLLTTHCHSARRESLALWTAEKTLKTLAEKYYRTGGEGDWPAGLKPFLHEGDALGLTPAANCYLALRALGGCVSYLTDCLLDIQVLGMAQFAPYAPPDVLNETLSPEEKAQNRWEGCSTMVLDAITLRNLRIVQDEGCLYEKLNFCKSSFGKRLLYQWLCAPSCNVSVIRERQEAVKELYYNQDVAQETGAILGKMPDLERLLAKVHSMGNLLRYTQHPDSRAIFYEDKIYSKRKVLDFIAVLNGFTAALGLIDQMASSEAKLLRRVMRFSPEGQYPDYRETLEFFRKAFNKEQAEKEGRILPGTGVDPEYDNTMRAIADVERDLKAYLDDQEKFFGRKVKYVGSDKKRYQLEVADRWAAKAGPEYNLEGKKKGFRMFSTAKTKELLARMIAAEEAKTNVLKDISRRIFEKFSSHYEEWETAVQCMAKLDVLLALAEFARQQNGDICLPDVTCDRENKPYINIVQGRHPCIPIIDEFIPNDMSLGVDGPLFLLLTGPNMGGKSTLMRTMGLITVLSHLGSYVPAQECSVSLVDRIFTRLGASDDILTGQSTFLVEMNETAAILKHATKHSLVLLDELGRGTSTYDGTAIASGVCMELERRMCRVVFSTHYHSLVNHLSSHADISLGHMACMVETDEATAESDDHIPEETITFLYKLTPGACPKSYGFNTARLAGIPKNITGRAYRVSRKLEKEATHVRAFKSIVKKDEDPQKVRKLLSELHI